MRWGRISIYYVCLAKTTNWEVNEKVLIRAGGDKLAFSKKFGQDPSDDAIKWK